MKKALLLVLVLMSVCLSACNGPAYTTVATDEEKEQLFIKVDGAKVDFSEYMNLSLSISASDAQTGLLKVINLTGTLKGVDLETSSPQFQLLLNSGENEIVNIYDDGVNSYEKINDYSIAGQKILSDSTLKTDSYLGEVKGLLPEDECGFLGKFEITLENINTMKKYVNPDQSVKVMFGIQANQASDIVKKITGFSFPLYDFDLSNTFLGVTVNTSGQVTELALESNATIGSTQALLKVVVKAVYSEPTINNTLDMSLFE